MRLEQLLLHGIMKSHIHALLAGSGSACATHYTLQLNTLDYSQRLSWECTTTVTPSVDTIPPAMDNINAAEFIIPTTVDLILQDYHQLQ